MPQQCSFDIYTKFLIANQNNYSALEMSKVSGVGHDKIGRWLCKKEPDTDELWNQVKGLVDKKDGYLVVDDSVMDKSFSRTNELTYLHWSGNAHALVNGISIVNLLWSNGDKYVPIDYRIYKPQEDKLHDTKNDHFKNLLTRAKSLKIKPFYVLADCWYGSLENMKFVDKMSWKFIFGAKENRTVSVTKGEYLKISELDWSKTQIQKVWLKDFGYVLVAKIVLEDETTRYVVTNDLELKNFDSLKKHNDKRWKIETFHRGIKQTTGIEKCYSTLAISQKNHIYACYLAFIKLEFTRIQTGVSWYEQKAQLNRISTKNAILA